MVDGCECGNEPSGSVKCGDEMGWACGEYG